MLLILGAGGCAREACFHAIADYANRGSVPEIVFYDDVSGISALTLGKKTYRVVSDFNRVKEAEFIAAVANPSIKKKLIAKALAAGLKPADTIIHPNVIIEDTDGIKIGKGGVISPNCVLTCNIRLGDFVVIGVSVSIGHDVVIEDFVTLNPGAVISGNVTIKENVMIGAGAVVIEKNMLEKGIVLGAQSCVTKDLIEKDHIYYGIPAMPKNKLYENS